MTKLILAAITGALALTVLTTSHASADNRCPNGQYYDEAKGKCVTKRGS